MSWACFRSGDCCERVERVAMTFSERRLLEAHGKRLGLTLQWRAGDRPTFTALVARPCPFLTRDADGLAACAVYDERPYNCRRWMCGRSSADEICEQRPIPLRVLRSHELRADYTALQAAAQPWADAHGWRSL